ncbi:hypothetical protein C8R42DRAFT_637587 [Lentinula raphanica]|nr:hypothetical protein C8R42DRAFT_637587 [Lentinula raphanica]
MTTSAFSVSASAATVSASMQNRRTCQGGVFDTVLAAKLAYNANSLALVDYEVQFTKACAFNIRKNTLSPESLETPPKSSDFPDFPKILKDFQRFSKQLRFFLMKDSNKFVGANGRESTTNFFGQIAADFTAHPTGNYTSPGNGPFIPINNSTHIKFAIGLECLTFVPPKMRVIFANQMATLGNVIGHDSESSKQPRIKSWIAPTMNTGGSNKFFFTTVPLYKVPNNARCPTNFKAKVDIGNDHGHGNPAPPVPAFPAVLGLPSKVGYDFHNTGAEEMPSGDFVDFASMLNTGGDFSIQASTSNAKHALDERLDIDQPAIEEPSAVVNDLLVHLKRPRRMQQYILDHSSLTIELLRKL